MSFSFINLELKLGTAIPSAAPQYIIEKLESIEITRTDNGPAGFQLHFHADRTQGLSQDFELLSSPLLKTSTRVIISVALNGSSTVLMDGFITHQELAHSRDFGASTLTVTGEDVSVLMDLVQLSFEYPQMGDGMIAGVVLAKYIAVGIIPEVIPTPADLIPLLMDKTPQQNATDRSYIMQLASTYGYIFHVKPGLIPLQNTAYFGPPLRVGSMKPPLSVDVGSASNVESLNFTFDALAPTLVDGFVQSELLDMDIPVSTFTSTRLPAFAENPALGLAKIFQKRALMTDPRFGAIKALVDAQASTDTSTDKVVVGQGELDVMRYGAILEAPGLVAVRGVGNTYDGKYYVQSVTHKIKRGSYHQSFSLTREGVGSTISNTN